VLFDTSLNLWFAIPLKNPLGRAIEPSDTETILLGAKDSFSEQLEQNITLIRKRIPTHELKTEKFTVGSLSETNVVLLYIEGLTNPEFVSIAKKKILEINYDLFFESSQVAAFIEENPDSIFPQFQQTDRPDVVAYSLGIGKISILVDNTPFALVAPITMFHLFQSPSIARPRGFFNGIANQRFNEVSNNTTDPVNSCVFASFKVEMEFIVE